MLIGTACAAVLAASALGSPSSHASPGAYVPGRLLSAARAHPSTLFHVILRGAGARGKPDDVKGAVMLSASPAPNATAGWGSAARGSAAWGSTALAQQLASGDAAWGSAAWGSVTSAEVPDNR